MKIRRIQWLSNEWGIRLVDLPANRVERTTMSRDRPGRTIVCRYWQIWHNGVERVVVDRALTKKKAIERVKHLRDQSLAAGCAAGFDSSQTRRTAWGDLR